MRTGVAVEKLILTKCSEISSRQDVLQATSSARVDIFYLQICGCFLRKRLFQHPQAESPTGRVTQYKRRPLCCRLWLFVSPLTERSAVMSQEKYIGMDVHQATISGAVLDSRGKLIMESILETKAATILEFIQGLRGRLTVTFEEGTSAAWLHDLLKPHVTRLRVCDPRKNALLKDGSKSDRIDARKLAELLR